ncbi:phage/plasmid primase, P4 family [Paraburkholderia sediminicola]|uniref:phage/plasmid primase, P4 family n=1 Tax=Paraburkholderia sediminicola TaxID=458836 RepID=UPI0038BA5A81
MTDFVDAQVSPTEYSLMAYTSEKANVGKQKAGTWEQVVALLSARHIRSEKSGYAFAPVEMKRGATRAKSNVLAIHMAVADIDTEGVKDKASGRVLEVTKRAPQLDQIRAGIQEYTWAAHSSHWHEPHRGVVKYRIVFPLARPCAPDEWPEAWQGLNILLGGHCDTACRDASRLYYLPSCPEESKEDAFFDRNEGGLLDPDYLISLARKLAHELAAPATPRNVAVPADTVLPVECAEQIERVKSMLAAISADCGRDQWRNVLWAVASTGWSCAEALVREWSQTAPQRFDAEAFDRTFQSFKPGGGVQFGTLVHIARESGWVEPCGSGLMSENARPGAGDVLNGRFFAHRYRDTYLFVHETGKMLTFKTGCGWTAAPPGEADRAAKAAIDAMAQTAEEQWQAAPRDTKYRRLVEHAERSSTLPKIRGMIELAKSEPGMTVQLRELDNDPMLLGVQNGILDLRTGTLLAPSPSLRVTKRCPVEFRPDATPLTFRKFIKRITRGAPALRPFLRRWAGYVLTGQTSEQCFLFLYGLGRNGKTTFAELLQWLLGDYAGPLPTSTLMMEKSDPGASRPDLMLLQGRRLALASELEEGAKFAEAAIKAMTGGDTMQARNPYGLYASWQATHKLMITGNHKPLISGSDFGMWRRLLLIPFMETITDDECDEDLIEKLRAEGSGVLNWALAGLRDWQQQGLNPPAVVRQAVAAYRSDMDILKQWMDDHVQQAPGAVTPTADLYRAYQTWARDAGWKNPMTRAAFGRRLAERGVQLIKGGATNTKCACDIALNDEGKKAAARQF